MKTEFSMDLRLARRRAGLIQTDVAHLTGMSVPRYSSIERGHCMPSVTEFFALATVLDRQFSSYCTGEIKAQRSLIFKRLSTLPVPKRYHPNLHGRELTLARLARLEDPNPSAHETG